VSNQAKVYRVKQVRGVIVSYGLAEEPEAEEPTQGEDAGEETGPAHTEEGDGR